MSSVVEAERVKGDEAGSGPAATIDGSDVTAQAGATTGIPICPTKPTDCRISEGWDSLSDLPGCPCVSTRVTHLQFGPPVTEFLDQSKEPRVIDFEAGPR